MKNAFVLALLCTVPFAPLSLDAAQSATTEPSFESFLRTWEEAQTRFINGDPDAWKQHTSKQDDVTILGGFGGAGEKGWQAVSARYDWASSQYRPGDATMSVDYLSITVHGDLALTVGVERQQNVRVGNQAELVRRALRATQIFRKENGGWKLLHRHADQVIEKQTPSRVADRQ